MCERLFEALLAEESCSGFSRFCDNVLSRKPSSGEGKLLGRVFLFCTLTFKFVAGRVALLRQSVQRKTLLRAKVSCSEESGFKLRTCLNLARSTGKLKHRSWEEVQTSDGKNAPVDRNGLSFVTKIEKTTEVVC